MTTAVKKLLDRIQASFPIDKRPFLKLSETFQLSEGEIIETLKELKEHGVIRRIGAILEPRMFGAEPVLLALRVEEGKVEEVGRETARYPEVTHCCEREGSSYNLWIVLTAEKGRKEKLIEEFKRLNGVKDLLALESEEVYKLKAVFRRYRC